MVNCKKHKLFTNIDFNWGFILTKSWLNIVSDNQRNKLGVAWFVIEPVLFAFVYFIVFNYIVVLQVKNGFLFILLGLSLWLWFAKCVSRSNLSIVSAKNILNTVKIEPINYVTIAFVQGTFLSLPLIFLIIIYSSLHNGLSLAALCQLVLLLISFGLVIFSCCIIFSLLGVFFSDFTNILPSALTALMFVSGVFFELNQEQKLHSMLLLNPIASAIQSYRGIGLHASITIQNTVYVAVWALTFTPIALMIYYSARKSILEKINE